MEHKNRVYHIMYFVMLLTIVGIIVWLCLHYQGSQPPESFFSESVPFAEGWVAEDGSPVDLSALADLEAAVPGQPFYISHTLPEELPEGTSFCFRSKNIFYQVYIDDELVYEPYVEESIAYNDTLGTRWNFIPLSARDAGRTISIKITTVYDSSRVGLSYVYLGSSGGVLLDMLKEKMVSFITCILILFVGVLLMVADIPINMQTKKNHELLYLGLFAVSIAFWCLSETNVLQFFFGDSQMLSVLSCCSLMLVSIPTVLYLDSAFGFRKRFVVPFISILSFSGFVLCMALHFLGIADFHETLHISHVILGVSAVLLFYTIIRHSLVKGKSQTKNVYRILRGFGLSSIAVATGIDMLRFYHGSGGDTALFVRIGLLIFILCYGSSSLEKTIQAVKLGIQTEFVSQLAYRDGLTGIGNRTAFQEHLVSLEEQKSELTAVGIIMFDVNELKFVNDYFGHHAGDSMLIQSANMIQEAFSSVQGDCYRIGGDEFSVIISGKDSRVRCEKGIEQFLKIVDAYNQDPEKPFRISIAHGYAMYGQEDADRKLMDIYQQADNYMYENKKWIKAHQPKLADLYSGNTAKLAGDSR